MRRIVKPDPPTSPGSYSDYALALANSEGVGRYCSFCEKALSQQLLLLHKQAGMIPAEAHLSGDNWSDLLLICADCAAAVVSFNPALPYYWPDTPVADQVPFVYRLVEGVTRNALGPEGGIVASSSVSIVLMQVAEDIDPTLRNAATLTQQLFQLNGRFFNNDPAAPAYEVPYNEYIERSDYRLLQRLDAFDRAKEAATVMGTFLEDDDVTAQEIHGLVKLMNHAIAGFGFLSTWEMAVQTTLAALNPDPRQKLYHLLNQQPIQPLPNRKRAFVEFQRVVGEAPEVVYKKCLLHDGRLRLITGEA
jgi:hypothetical protein